MDTERTVMTYEPDGWPKGIITGYRSGDGFCLEHVVAFEKGQLPALIRAGLEEAHRQGFGFLTFHLPHTFVLAETLGKLALRVGFVRYAHDDEASYYVRYFGGPKNSMSAIPTNVTAIPPNTHEAPTKNTHSAMRATEPS